MEFRNNEHLKSYLKKEAERLNISPAAAQSTFFCRLLLSRVAGSNYGTYLVKGSFSQFVHLKKLTRPVLDIDLTSYKEEDAIEQLYSAIYEQNNPKVVYDVTSEPKITQNGVYKIPVKVEVKVNPTDKPFLHDINIDFKKNNPIIFETQYKCVEPIFEGDTPFYINTPSYEEHLAEKLYIILHNRKSDVLNTRVKDFYDIYKLHGGNYDSNKFAIYFQAMLKMYGENLYNIDTRFLDKTFIRRHQELWERMSKKYEFTDKTVDLDEAVYYTRAVLNEQLQKTFDDGVQEEAKKLVRNLNNKDHYTNF
jgi:hypothetical protein